eukprot:FR743494.1.p1 GENE.FR743494.1~~FR743494.1.p1  ORF type:complete len:202 (+),score=23.03 FR743494.1:62-667(+)
MGAAASINAERIPRDLLTRIVVAYIAKNASDVSDDEFLNLVATAGLEEYLLPTDMPVVRRELDTCLKAHARVETSLGTMEIVEQTVSQLKHKFSGGDPPDLASAHRHLDHGNHSMDADQNPDAGETKHGDASATDFEARDAMSKLLLSVENPKGRLSASLVNYIRETSGKVLKDDEFAQILRDAKFDTIGFSKAEVVAIKM